jgi:L-aspartate oxidase
VSSALAEAARVGSRVQLYENEFVIDLLTVDGRCVGALTLNLDDGGLTLNVAMVTILATGGAGQVFGRTTNPLVATGDGVAMAYRAGAAIRDLEFVQFHPTGLAVPGQETVQLITEALRGEGAYLRNAAGERFMTEYDPRGELASRDVVVRAMMNEMRKEGSEHVFLDATHLDSAWLQERFPRVTAGLAAHNLDLATQLIPVAPVCHYFIGGVVTDVWGRTTVPGLYASGEVASTGVHGANRLASNSLLEGLVYSDRVVRDLDRYVGRLGEDVRRLRFDLPEATPGARSSDVAAARRRLTDLMANKVGVLRRGDELAGALADLGALTTELQFGAMGEAEYELLNMLTLGTQIAKCALLREESRGVHLRDDYPAIDDADWRRHITLRLPAHEREEGLLGKVERS